MIRIGHIDEKYLYELIMKFSGQIFYTKTYYVRKIELYNKFADN